MRRLGYVVSSFSDERCSLTKICETLVLQLPIAIQNEELHHHNCGLPQREGFVEGHSAHISAAAFGVTLHQLRAGIKAGQRRGCLREGLTAWRVIGLSPVIQQEAQINQWVPKGALVPVEERDNTRDIDRINHVVIELKIIMKQAWCW
jgi:hypothetical protein